MKWKITSDGFYALAMLLYAIHKEYHFVNIPSFIQLQTFLQTFYLDKKLADNFQKVLQLFVLLMANKTYSEVSLSFNDQDNKTLLFILSGFFISIQKESLSLEIFANRIQNIYTILKSIKTDRKVQVAILYIKQHSNTNFYILLDLQKTKTIYSNLLQVTLLNKML